MNTSVQTLGGLLLMLACSTTLYAQPRLRSGFIAIDDGSLYYEMAGDGQTVVLIHGFTLDRRMWDAQFADLAENYRTLRYDLRGHGKSSSVSDTFNHVDDLAALLGGLSIDRAHLIGLSLGGCIATDFSIAYPERVHDAVLIDPYYPLSEGFAFDARIREHISIAREKTLADGLERWLNDPLFAPACERPHLKLKLTEIVLEGHGAKRDGAMFINVEKNGKSPLLEGKTPADIRCRVLCLVGKRDLPRFHAVADHLSRTIPKLDVVIVPDAGHMANMENPTFVLSKIKDFLDH